MRAVAATSSQSIDILEHREDDGWQAYTSAQPNATLFHHWPYRQVVAGTFGHKPYYLSAHHGGEIAGVLPLFVVKSWLFGRQLVSLPFADYGGLCGREDAIPALIQAATTIARAEGADSIELRHRQLNIDGLITKLDKVNLNLPLAASSQAVWSELSGKVRNQVRKAIKSGLEFHVGGIELVDDFYRVWSRNMRDLGTPAYPLAFFRRFLTAFCANSEVMVVWHHGRPVGAGIAIYDRDAIEVPWASSLKQYSSLCANNLLYWEAIKRGCERRCLEFRFGRSTKGSGPYRFKKQWGAEDEQLYYQSIRLGATGLPDLDPHSPKYRLAVTIWRRLPLAIANRLGPLIARNIP